MGYWPSRLIYRGEYARSGFGRENERGRERMSEASGGGRAEMERRIVQRSIEDESFKQRLLEDPKAAVEQELGTRLPEDVRVVAVEETAETIYLVLPSASQLGEGGELSDRELEGVAGGLNAGTGFPTDALHPECC
jgi:hypothetical protein